MSITEQLVSESKLPTLASIHQDIKNGDNDCLYYATEKQINTLIDQDKIDEDYSSYHQDYQEEMRCLVADAMEEFG